MGFLVLAKHGLNKTWIRAFGLSFFERPNHREREGKRKREKKRKRKKMEEQKGMELHGILKFCMNFHAWMVSSLSPNLGFC